MSRFDLSRRQQLLLFAGVFALVVAILGFGYYRLANGGYSVLADRVRPGEAAAIVAELDKRGTAYELKDGGTTVLVPSAEADATRLALVRSDAAVAGQIGFELFNKSDMGLTNFAQKINYQRALQGELVRTITLMDGVETARVHLALPERALFRDDRTEPTAAVTIQMRAGLSPAVEMVSGIQNLVAASVSDLPAERVVVLDAEGRVISQVSGGATGRGDSTVAGEARSGVERYYHARVRAAIESVERGLRYQLRVGILPDEGAADSGPWMLSGSGEARNFRIRLVVATANSLDANTQSALIRAIEPAISLDPGRGDILAFETGLLSTADPAQSTQNRPTPRRATEPRVSDTAAGESSADWWLSVIAVMVLAAILVARHRRRSATELSLEEREAFADTLRRQIALIDRGDHAAR